MADTTPRVLVVDDERFFREAICDALSEAGIDCDEVATGEEALLAARDAEVGVVVLDVTLSDMTGIEVLRRLHAERPAVRVIMLSAHADQEMVLEALRLDASDYLAKPLHDEELVLAVRRALANFDVESSWLRLRERLRRLQGHLEALATHLDRPGDSEATADFAAAMAEALADVLGAGKTSLMIYDEARGELRVAAATGSPLDASQMDPVVSGEGVAGVALSLGEAVIVDDVYTDDRFSGRAVHDRYQSSSLAVAPLRDAEHPLGVLCATDRAGGVPFGDDELALLRILALPAARFLAAARQAEEPSAEPPQAAAVADEVSSSDGDRDAELAREICEALTLEIDPERLLAGALRPIAKLPGAALVALHLIDNASGELVVECELEGAGPSDRPRLPRDRGLTALALQGGALVVTDHPEDDPRFDAAIDTAADGEVRPLLCAPIRLRGKVLGVLRLFCEPGTSPSPRTGEVLAAAVSAAVRNVLLYRSLLESIDEVADARREAGAHSRGA